MSKIFILNNNLLLYQVAITELKQYPVHRMKSQILQY